MCSISALQPLPFRIDCLKKLKTCSSLQNLESASDVMLREKSATVESLASVSHSDSDSDAEFEAKVTLDN